METNSFLPVIVNTIKDAARSAKDGIGQATQAVKNFTVSQLLDIDMLIVTELVIEQRAGQEILHLYCKFRHDLAMCPRCKEVSSKLHEEKERCIRDSDIWCKRTFLHFPSRRFDCEHCGRPFTEELNFVEKKRRQTIRFELHVYHACLSSSRKAVARENWLHDETVKVIFKRWGKRAVRSQAMYQVRVLGVDEIALKKRHKQYVLVLSDIERRCIIAVLEDRTKKRFEKWLDDLGHTARMAIQIVSIDMWDPYRQAVRKKLSHATLVADRFHVMKQLNSRIDQLRRSIQRKADKETAQILKGCRWLLLKNRNDLKPEEEERLSEVLNASPELRTIYLLKEEFRLIYEKMQDRQQAERFLKVWAIKARYTGHYFLCKFVSTLKNWWNEILNYFENHVTNGFVEGINRAIRTIINKAYGYKIFENFRLQILCRHGGKTVFSHKSG